MPALRFTPAVLVSVLLCLPPLAIGQSTIHIPADQPSIQAGINAAKNGDTVLIAPGTYFENIDFLGKAITVTSSDGAAKTIIDGGGKGTTVIFKNYEPRAAILSNLTITHGDSNGGSSNFPGGGVGIFESQPTLLNNIITQNYCQNIVSEQAAPLIQGNIVSSSLTPEKCSVSLTGGIFLGGNLQFSSNFDSSDGYPAIILGNTIENNTTGQSGDGGGDGGPGIAIWGGSPLIQGNIIRNNVTRSGSGGAVNVVYGSKISIVQNLIYGNTAGCGGGAIGAEPGSLGPETYLLIANNTIVNDTGGLGGLYSDCRKSSEVWTAFYNGGGPSIKFVNNIIQANIAPALDCGSYNSNPDEAHQSLFDHNLLYNTAGPFLNSNCLDSSHLHGNLVADPQFVDVAGHDFHLRSSSPAIDAGNGSVLQNLKLLSGVDLTKDFDGKPREQDATGKGTPIIDIGAYEFSGLTNNTPTRIVLSSSAVSGAAGSKITLTATLSSSLGVPTGSATFFEDGRQIGSAVITGGVATLNGVAFTPGAHTLYATYDGQAGFQPAISVYIVLDLDRYETTLSLTNTPSTSITGQPILFSVHASSSDNTYIPAPIQLTESSGNTTLATLTPDASGNASFTTSSFSLGAFFVTAYYAGDTLHAPGSAMVFQRLVSGYSTTVVLNSSPNPAGYGQQITFAAHVSSPNGTPTGTVQFTDDGNGTLATVPLDTSGNAIFSTATLSVGTHTITASYTPSGAYAGSSSSVTQTVNGLPVKAVLSATPLTLHLGDSIALNASVTASTGSATPTGSVSFLGNGLLLGTSPLNSAGTASLNTSSLTAGSNSLTCTYSGDLVYSPATCAPILVTAQAADTTTTLVSSANPAPALSPVTFTATLTSGGQPSSGGVHFSLDGKPLAGGTPGPAGSTSIQLSLPAGVHTITAQFTGAVGVNGSSTTLSQTIEPNPTASSLNPFSGPVYQNQRLGLTSHVQPLTGTAQPYGTVTLHDGAAVLATQIIPATQNTPIVAFDVASLAPGPHLLYTVYTPADNNFLASISPALSVTVLPQTFNFTASVPTITIQAEHHGSMQLTLASIGGWAGPVQLGCADPLPPILSCRLAQNITLGPDSTVSTTLTLDTDAVPNFKSSLDHKSVPLSRRGQPVIAFAGVLLPLACLACRGRSRNAPLKLLVLLLALTSFEVLSGCGGKYPDHTPPGTYNITLFANGTANQASAPTSAVVQIKLVVTP